MAKDPMDGIHTALIVSNTFGGLADGWLAKEIVNYAHTQGPAERFEILRTPGAIPGLAKNGQAQAADFMIQALPPEYTDLVLTTSGRAGDTAGDGLRNVVRTIQNMTWKSSVLS